MVQGWSPADLWFRAKLHPLDDKTEENLGRVSSVVSALNQVQSTWWLDAVTHTGDEFEARLVVGP